MKTLSKLLSAVLVALIWVTPQAQAHDRDWRGHGGYRGHYEPHEWSRGSWRHAEYHGRYGWWWVVGASWFFYPGPYYPQPMYPY